MLFLFFSLFLSFLRNVPSGLPGGTFRFCETGWRKSYPAGGFGGKKRGKGNRQGFLSRSITRRSGRIAKQYYKKFCNFEGSLAKDPKGLFDKLTVRLAGRYISFLCLGVEKPVQPKVSEGRQGENVGVSSVWQRASALSFRGAKRRGNLR